MGGRKREVHARVGVADKEEPEEANAATNKSNRSNRCPNQVLY